MALAGKYRLVIEQGSEFELQLVFLDEVTLEKLDFANYTIRCKAREAYDSVSAIFSYTEDNEHLILDPDTNMWRFRIDADDTAAFNFDSGVWDLELVPITQTSIPIAGAYTQAAIDVSNPDLVPLTHGVITANGGTPFGTAGAAAGDIIRVTTTENGNEGSYVLYSATNTILRTTSILNGTDNSADTTINISLLELDEANVQRWLNGAAALKREATY